MDADLEAAKGAVAALDLPEETAAEVRALIQGLSDTVASLRTR